MRSHSRSCMSEVGVRDGQSPYSQPVCFRPGMPSICRSVNNRMHTGQSVYNGEAQCWLVCSDRECHLLAGLSSTECIPAGQFKIVKHNAGRSVQTGNAIYWPVC